MSAACRTAKASIVIDADQAPLYLITMTGDALDQEFDDYLAELSRVARRGSPCAFVYDARRATPATPSQRKKQASWMKEHEVMVRSHTAGIAFVLPNALMRGVLTAVLWLQPLACPHLVTVSLEEGLRWAREQLGDHSPVPSRTRGAI